MWKKIVSADDCEVAYDLMDWCGVRDIWDRNDLEAYYNFFNDVARDCDHILIDLKPWDANMPGHSGVWHTVRTDDAKALKKELRSGLARLLWESRKRIRDYRIREEEEERAEQEKRHRESEQRLKELENGPTDGIFICSMGIWDDVTPYSMEYYFELSPEDPQCLKVWGKLNKTWTSCWEWQSRFNGNMKTEAAKLLNNRKNYYGSDSIFDVVLGPLFEKEPR